MEYFKLEQDKRVPYGVLMQGLSKMENIQDTLKGNIIPLKRMNVVFVPPSRFNWYPDVLDRQLFLVQENVKEAFDLYQPDLQYRYFCLLDNQNQVHKFYYAPALEMVDCLSEESGCNLDKSVIRNVVLRKESIDGKDLFRIAGVKELVVIVSLPMAESLLRRRPKGIRISHVEIM